MLPGEIANVNKLHPTPNNYKSEITADAGGCCRCDTDERKIRGCKEVSEWGKRPKRVSEKDMDGFSHKSSNSGQLLLRDNEIFVYSRWQAKVCILNFQVWTGCLKSLEIPSKRHFIYSALHSDTCHIVPNLCKHFEKNKNSTFFLFSCFLLKIPTSVCASVNRWPFACRLFRGLSQSWVTYM